MRKMNIPGDLGTIGLTDREYLILSRGGLTSIARVIEYLRYNDSFVYGRREEKSVADSVADKLRGRGYLVISPAGKKPEGCTYLAYAQKLGGQDFVDYLKEVSYRRSKDKKYYALCSHLAGITDFDIQKVTGLKNVQKAIITAFNPLKRAYFSRPGDVARLELSEKSYKALKEVGVNTIPEAVSFMIACNGRPERITDKVVCMEIIKALEFRGKICVIPIEYNS